MLRVLVVDDRADLRQVFAELLDGQPDLRVVAQAGSLAEAHHMGADGIIDKVGPFERMFASIRGEV